jgi:signal transduction histidine kinase
LCLLVWAFFQPYSYGRGFGYAYANKNALEIRGSHIYWLFPIYLLCLQVVSLDAIARPDPSARMMGDLARQRARPWLVITTLTLLAVTIILAGFILYSNLGAGDIVPIPFSWLFLTDLALSFLILLAVLSLGQALVRYEIFTGASIPRAGLRRQWHRTVWLAFGYAPLVSAGLFLPIHPVYATALGALLLTSFFALLGWRINRERERHMQDLRPFVSRGNWSDAVSQPLGNFSDAGRKSFDYLVSRVLEAGRAYLVTLDTLSPKALCFPSNLPLPIAIQRQHWQFSPETICQRVDGREFGGAEWVVPLWSGRGLSGMLLLAPRPHNGLYAREEMEIARAACEQILDNQNALENTQKLVQFQRTRLQESQVVDQQTRRTLHDEVLPQLHTAMLQLPEGTAPNAIEALALAHKQISRLLRQLPSTTLPELEKFGVLGMLQRSIGGEFANLFDEVSWDIDDAGSVAIQKLDNLSREVLYHAAREAIRNAGRYARKELSQRLTLKLSLTQPQDGWVELVVTDDGQGLEQSLASQPQKPAPGRDSAETTRQGHGLALHSTLLAVLGGSLHLENGFPGTRVVFRLKIENPVYS